MTDTSKYICPVCHDTKNSHEEYCGACLNYKARVDQKKQWKDEHEKQRRREAKWGPL